jgi:hypothetical protein
LFFVEQAIWTSSILNRFQPQGFKQVNKYLPGVYYVPSKHCEVSPWYAIGARGDRLAIRSKSSSMLSKRISPPAATLSASSLSRSGSRNLTRATTINRERIVP